MTLKNKKSSSLADLMPQGDLNTRILEQRATHLAQQFIDKKQTTQTNHYVRFRLGDNEFYGIPFQYVNEVIFNTTPTKVPHTPDWIAGIINRNGVLLSVIDLKPPFNLPTQDNANRSYLIVITVNGVTAAILADHIEGSESYDSASLDAPLTSHAAIKSSYLLGLHKGTTAILNMETLMSILNITSVKEMQ